MSKMFILGSGFSASCGLPTLNGLFTGLMAYGLSQDGAEFKQHTANVRVALQFFYPHFNNAKGDDGYPSFEEFLTYLSTAAEFEGIFKENYWSNTLLSATFLLTNFIDKKTQMAKENASLSSLTKFINNLKAGDVIITFNWDTLIEQALVAKGIIPSLVAYNPESVTVLKLHGSLSWLNMPPGLNFAKAPHPPECFPLSKDIFCTSNHQTFPTWFSLNQPPFIITPTRIKTPFQVEFFKKIWQEAFKAIRDIRKEQGSVTVIGYSLPYEDLHARVLLRSGLKAPTDKPEGSLVIIDPDPAISGKYFSAITKKLIFHQRCFTGDEI